MRLRPNVSSLFLLVATLVGTSGDGMADADKRALRTEFGEIRLQNLAIGKTYSVAHIAAAPLVIENTSDEALHVRVLVVIPSHHELRAGVEPLPDRSWVRLERADFVLPARTTVLTDVRLSLPYDPDLAGKTFQVDLWSRDVSSEPEKRGPGQRHRLLFNVEMDYRDDTEAQFSMRQPD